MEVERNGLERLEWRLGGRGKKGLNVGWEEGERQDQVEVGRKGKKR